MGERGEADAALAPGLQRAPVERKAGRRRLERDRVGGDRRPHIPQAPAAAGTCAYWIGRPCRASPASICGAAADEAQLDKARMAGKTLDDGGKRARAASRSPGDSGGGGAPVFRARAMIAGAEDDGDEAGGIAERHPAGEPDLDRLAARQHACRVRLAGKVAASLATTRSPAREQVRQRGARQMTHAAVRRRR